MRVALTLSARQYDAVNKYFADVVPETDDEIRAFFSTVDVRVQ